MKWASKDEKPPKGAAHKAPKKWWDEKVQKIKKDNPSYSDETVAKVVGDIWDNKLSDAERERIYRRYGKKKNPNAAVVSKLIVLADQLNFLHCTKQAKQLESVIKKLTI